MPTVGGMFKRILTLGAGVALGLVLAVAGARVAVAWGWLPNRDLNRSMDYLRDIVQMVNENYVDADAARYDALAKSAAHGMVESLDPHSEFLEAKDYAELEEELSGDFSGIGIQIELRRGHVLVIAPIAHSPADRAGIRHGDEIVAVDGHPLDKGITLDGVVDRLRGKPKTTVTIDFLRPATGKRFPVTLQREMIAMESVRRVMVLADHIGYIQITDFSEHTAEDFRNAVNSLLQQDITGLIIDLRNNPGGLLDAAVEVAEPFFKKDELIVSTRGRKPDDDEEFRSELDGDPLTLPLAVLINADTASAAEVVTGALKDTGRAVVVGERSFGKGSVQTVFPLKHGEGLRLTTAKYYTPSGVSIHQKGITPNVRIVLTADEDSELQVQMTRDDVTDPREFKERFGFAPIADRQLAAAEDVLKAVTLLDERHAAIASGR